MKSIMVLLFISFFCVGAGPKGWSPITSAKRKTCTLQSKCLVKQRRQGTRFQVLFDVKNKDNMFWLKKVSIKNLKNNKTQSFSKLDNFQGLFPGEEYKLYAVDLNGDGFLDLALEASRSLRLGYFYFYWIYNSKKNQFILSDEQLPELHGFSSKEIRSAVNEEIYRVEKNFKLKRVK